MIRKGNKYYNEQGEQVCPECGVVFVADNGNQIYCKTKVYIGSNGESISQCQARKNSRLVKRKLRLDPEYREKQNNYMKAWREKKKAMGLCTVCGKWRPSPGYVVCEECLARNYSYK